MAIPMGGVLPDTWTETHLAACLAARWDGEGPIVLGNRQPFRHDRDARGNITVSHSASGVVNAVEPILRACGGVWVGHGAGSADREAVVWRDGLDVPPVEPRYRLRRVWLDPDEEQGYYGGFANQALWPLCHRVRVQPVFRAADFRAYASANRRFADAVCDEAASDAPLVLVQDYHFALAPDMIRARMPRATIVTFWHIPWPEWQTLGACPWARELLEGLLGSNIIGFQTTVDGHNFIEGARQILGAWVDDRDRAIRHGGRRIRVRAYPVSVVWDESSHADESQAAAWREDVRREVTIAPDVRLGVGVDRLDYTKGIEEKLLAIESLLERHPEHRQRFTFVQLAEPTREGVAVYQAVHRSVMRAAERVNRRFGTASYRPVIVLEGHHPPDRVHRFLRAADLCYVGSLHDGMNLVSKEFVRARADERGVLVLSAFAGAARELTDALVVNPLDTAGAARALAAALTMPEDEQRRRMRRMRAVVAHANAHRWAATILTEAAAARQHHAVWTPGPVPAGSAFAASGR
ncbi:MAG: alpha,alpha-trehalose-phosphate synthase (UDP-forming) [Vicinamibacterales bacterium]